MSTSPWAPSAGTGARTDNNPSGPNPAVRQPGTIRPQLVLPVTINIPQPAFTNYGGPQPGSQIAPAQPASPGVDAIIGSVHVKNPA
jgi:hypothetical protein